MHDLSSLAEMQGRQGKSIGGIKAQFKFLKDDQRDTALRLKEMERNIVLFRDLLFAALMFILIFGAIVISGAFCG